jgi:hypothetical protein
MSDFDIKRDNELIAAGTHFWCEACLIARPLDDQSPDPRYCQGCYDFLLKEARMLKEAGSWRRPDWIPKLKTSPKKVGYASTPTPRNMSTLKEDKIEVDIIQPSVAKVAHGKRGPKRKVLPDDLIKRWAGEGMGGKAIATRLKIEHGVKVSYKTIQRVLSGERMKLSLPISGV